MNLPLAKALIEIGFNVVPVASNGTPYLAWKDTDIPTEQELSTWERRFPLAGLAIVAGVNDVLVLDVDVNDAQIARHLRQWTARQKWDVIIRERSGSPRFAIIGRTNTPDAQRFNCASHDFEGHRIECFFSSHLLMVDGQHRKDKDSTYNLIPKRIGYLKSHPLNTLTPLGIEEIQALFGQFAWLCEREGLIKTKDSTMKSFIPTESVESSFNDAELTAIMDDLDVDDYHDWLNLGFALHKATDKYPDAFTIWDTWSQTSEKYPGRSTLLAKWASFSDDREMSLFVLYKRMLKRSYDRKLMERSCRVREEQIELLRKLNKAEPGSLQDMLLNYVMVAQGARVADLTKPIGDSLRTIAHMRDYLRNRKTLVKNKRDKEEKVNTFDLWLNSPERREAWDVTYRPCGARIIVSNESDTAHYYNTYQAPDVHIIEPAPPLPHLFENHLRYLFPENGHEWMLNWMAQLVQEPHIRYRTNPLSISLFEGTGRGWLTEVLIRLVGETNYATIQDIGEVIRPGAKTGYLDGTVLLVINEVYVQGKERFTVLNKMKTIFSDNRQDIDIKYGAQKYNQEIYTRVFMQSNHVNGLVLDESDSRIQPFINRERPRSRDYYNDLYAALQEPEFIDCIYSALLRYPLNTDWLKHSLPTRDRSRVLSTSTSATTRAWNDFRALMEEDNFPFTRQMVFDFCTFYCACLAAQGDEGASFNPREIKRLLGYTEEKGNFLAFNRFTDADTETVLGGRLMRAKQIISDYERELSRRSAHGKD